MREITYFLLIILFSSLISNQGYAIGKNQETCAEALGFGQELRNFYAAKEAFLKSASIDDLVKTAELHNYMLKKARAVPSRELHIAAFNNDTRSIKLLISRGMQVDVLGNEGLTPLGVAAGSGHINSIDLLLDLGASINAPDVTGASSLHHAATAGHVDAAFRLLDRGANIDSETIMGETPIMYAVRSGHSNMVRALASRGANVMAISVHGGNLLHMALIYDETVDRSSIIETILDLEEISPDIIQQKDIADGASPLHWAAYNGHIDAAFQLLNRGANIDQTTFNGETPIMYAVSGGHSNMVRFLASRGANVMVTNIQGQTLLHKAIIDDLEVKDRSGMIETILDLEKISPDIIQQADVVYGASPLHWAAFEGHVDVIDVLLQRGARLDAKNNDGELPIHVAARANQKQAFLVLKNADPSLLSVENKKGDTPVDTANRHHSKEILSALDL